MGCDFRKEKTRCKGPRLDASTGMPPASDANAIDPR